MKTTDHYAFTVRVETGERVYTYQPSASITATYAEARTGSRERFSFSEWTSPWSGAPGLPVSWRLSDERP